MARSACPVYSVKLQSVDGYEGVGGEDTYRHLLLRDNYCAVLAPHAQGCDVCRRDGLECIFWSCQRSAQQRLPGPWWACGMWHGAGTAYRLDTDDPGRRRFHHDRANCKPNVSVVAGASCERVQLAAAGGREVRAAGAGNAPDMMAGCVVVFMCRGVVQLRSSRKLGVSFWAWVPVDGGRLSSTRYALRAAWSCRLSGKAIIARGRRDWRDWLPCLLGTSKNSPAPSHLASAFS